MSNIFTKINNNNNVLKVNYLNVQASSHYCLVFQLSSYQVHTTVKTTLVIITINAFGLQW